MRIRHPRPSLSHDVIKIVVDYATPPAFLLDPSIVGGPWSTWSRAVGFLKDCSSVSHEWHRACIRLLYRIVVLRRPGQITSLLETLQTTGHAHSLYTRSIHLSFYVPAGSENEVNNQLVTLLQLCPNITSTNLAPVEPNGILKVYSPLLHSVLPLVVRLSVLDLTALAFDATIQSIVSLAAPRVQSLRISFLRSSAVQHFPGGLLDLNFPHLETFHPKVSEARQLREMIDHWDMPLIASLTLTGQTGPDEGWTEEHLQFIRSTGQHLRYLSLDASAVLSSSFIQRIIDVCPSLLHLVLSQEPSEDLVHPTIRFMDYWVPWWYPIPLQTLSSHPLNHAIISPTMPSLTDIRVLDSSLRFLPSLPQDLPPGEINTSDKTVVLNYPGIAICHPPGHVYQIDDDKDWFLATSEARASREPHWSAPRFYDFITGRQSNHLEAHARAEPEGRQWEAVDEDTDDYEDETDLDADGEVEDRELEDLEGW